MQEAFFQSTEPGAASQATGQPGAENTRRCVLEVFARKLADLRGEAAAFGEESLVLHLDSAWQSVASLLLKRHSFSNVRRRPSVG
jgi:hypothetical protein